MSDEGAGGRRRPGLDRFDLAALAVLLLTFLALALSPLAPKRLGDVHFHLEARALARALKGDGDLGDVALAKAPLASLWYVPPYLLVPEPATDEALWRAAVAWNLAAAAAALLLVRRAAELVASPLAGRVAVVLVLASPFALYYGLGVLAEPPAHLGAALLAHGWALARTRGYPLGWQVPAGLALLVLSRPNAVLVLVFAAGAAVALRGRGGAGRLVLLGLATCAALAMAFGAFSHARSARPSARRAGAELAHVMLQGRFQYRTEPRDWRYWNEATRVGSADFADWLSRRRALELEAASTGEPLPRVQARWLVADALAHPFLLLRQAVLRALGLHVPVVHSRPPEAFGGWAGWLLFHAAVHASSAVLVVGAAGFVVARRRALAESWVLWSPWAAIVVFHAATYAEPRYLFPARAGLAIMAAVAFEPIVARIAGRLRGALGRA